MARAATPQITVQNITKTSVDINAVYPTSGGWGNRLELQNADIDSWVDISKTFTTVDGKYSGKGLDPNTNYRARLSWYNNGWYVKDAFFKTPCEIPTLTINSISTNSISINAKYPISGNYGNRLELQNVKYDRWQNISDSWNVENGNYSKSGLNQDREYMVRMLYLQRGQWVCIDKYVTLPYSSQSLNSTYGNYVYTSLESYDLDLFTGNNHSTWLNRLDQVYGSMRDFTGAVPYNGSKIEIRTDREIEEGIWAYAGNPIRNNQNHMWHQVLKINDHGDWSNGVIHELGHDFTSSRWEFEAEFWAEFMNYYAMVTNNAKVNAGSKYYVGAEYKNYIASENDYQNYSDMISSGRYLPYASGNLFVQISDSIGWEPFKKTFRYFNSLPASEVPNSSIEKFNLFVTKLSDYSGRDVFSMMSEKEKTIFGSAYGGKVERVIFDLANFGDWNSFDLEDESGNKTTVYIKDNSNSGSEKPKAVAINHKDSSVNEMYFINGKWEVAGKVSRSSFSSNQALFNYYTNLFSSGKTKVMIKAFVSEMKPEVIKTIVKLYGIKESDLSNSDHRSIMAAISDSANDNLFNGVVNKVAGLGRNYSNLTYARAKAVTDVFFIAGFGATAELSSGEIESKVKSNGGNVEFYKKVIAAAQNDKVGRALPLALLPVGVVIAVAVILAVSVVSLYYISLYIVERLLATTESLGITLGANSLVSSTVAGNTFSWEEYENSGEPLINTEWINNNLNKTVEEILKIKKGSIKNAPKKPGDPAWETILAMTLNEILKLSQGGDKGFARIYKLLTDGRFNK